MKAFERYSGEVIEISPERELNELKYMYIEKPSELKYSSFFKYHPDAFSQIASVQSLSCVSLTFRGNEKLYGATLKKYQVDNSHVHLYINPKGLITDFTYDSGDSISFVWSPTEEKIYWTDRESYDPQIPEDITDTEIIEEIKEIMHKIYN